MIAYIVSSALWDCGFMVSGLQFHNENSRKSSTKWKQNKRKLNNLAKVNRKHVNT